MAGIDAKAKELLNGREIWECANQLAGWVGPGTEDRLAKFLLRESDAAEALARVILLQAETITALQAENTRLREVLNTFERNRPSNARRRSL